MCCRWFRPATSSPTRLPTNGSRPARDKERQYPMSALNTLMGLALPGRFGGRQETLADKSFKDTASILAAFGVRSGAPAPGKPVRLMRMSDVNATSEASALQPASRDDQFSIKISHGIYKLASHLTKRDGFDRMVLNFQRDEASNRWKLQDIDYRRFEDSTSHTITRDDLNARDFGRLSQAAQQLVAKAARLGAAGDLTALNRFGAVVNSVAGNHIDAVRLKPGPTDTAPSPMKSAA